MLVSASCNVVAFFQCVGNRAVPVMSLNESGDGKDTTTSDGTSTSVRRSTRQRRQVPDPANDPELQNMVEID